jgi:hypothetical protein
MKVSKFLGAGAAVTLSAFNAGGLRLKFLIFQVDQKDLELDGRVRNPGLGLVQGHGRYFLQPDLQHHGRALPAGQEL